MCDFVSVWSSQRLTFSSKGKQIDLIWKQGTTMESIALILVYCLINLPPLRKFWRKANINMKWTTIWNNKQGDQLTIIQRLLKVLLWTTQTPMLSYWTLGSTHRGGIPLPYIHNSWNKYYHSGKLYGRLPHTRYLHTEIAYRFYIPSIWTAHWRLFTQRWVLHWHK